MKHLLILLAGLTLFACGGGDTGGSSEKVVETDEDTVETVGADVADATQSAMEKAADVGDALEAHKDAVDEAVEEAD